MREAGLNQSSWFEGYALPSWNKNPLSDAYFEFFRRPEFNREFKTISPDVNTATAAALNWVEPRRDPLVLDMDGGGITTSGINTAAPILFDQDGDGTLTATGWIASGEAIVVRDLNANGRIDSGRELFGDSTVLTRGPNAGQLASNGFTALADLDANAAGLADGKFDASDAAFASVKLWKDLNQNGVSEAGEPTDPQQPECRMPCTPSSQKFGLHCAKSGSSRRARRLQCRCDARQIRTTNPPATSPRPLASRGWQDPVVFQEQHVYPQPQLQTATL